MRSKDWTSDWVKGTTSPPMHLTLLAESPRFDFDFPRFIYLGGVEIVLAFEK